MMQKVLAFIVGGLVIATSILTLLANIALPLTVVRSIWNTIFGIIIIFVQLKWRKFIGRNFGFLKHWCMRGMFYIFVGSNCMTTTNQFLQDLFSFIVGGSCCFVGAIELCFGCKMGEEMDKHFKDEDEPRGSVSGAADGNTPASKYKVGFGGFGLGAKKDKKNSVEPTLSVTPGTNMTPAQAVQNSGWAATASSGGSYGSSSGYTAPAPVGGSGGGGSGGDNPFFGNAHLGNP